MSLKGKPLSVIFEGLKERTDYLKMAYVRMHHFEKKHGSCIIRAGTTGSGEYPNFLLSTKDGEGMTAYRGSTSQALPFEHEELSQSKDWTDEFFDVPGMKDFMGQCKVQVLMPPSKKK